MKACKQGITRIYNKTTKYSIEMPPNRILDKVLLAGQENSMVSQFYSILVSRRIDGNLLRAPLNLIYCIDIYKMVKVFELRQESYQPDTHTILILGFINALLSSHSMVLKANELELGTNLLDLDLGKVEEIVEEWELPSLVIPIFILAMGYPEEKPLEHRKFPSKYIFFEESYLSEENFDFLDLFYDLDRDRNLIDYYKNLTMISSKEKVEFGNWLDMMKYNCDNWEAKKSELMKICKYCGVDFTKGN